MGLRCRCRRRGQDRLFSDYLAVEPHCEVCGLDFAFIDSGDGGMARPLEGILIALQYHHKAEEDRLSGG